MCGAAVGSVGVETVVAEDQKKSVVGESGDEGGDVEVELKERGVDGR